MDFENKEVNQASDSQKTESSDNSVRKELDSVDQETQKSVQALEQARTNAAAQAFLPDFDLSFDTEVEHAAPACEQPEPANKFMNAEDSKESSEKLFDIVDKNGDGFMSQDELDEAVNNKCIAGKDAQVLLAMREQREKLQDLSNDELGFENDGISRADMKKFQDDAAAKRPEIDEIRHAKYYAEDNFEKLDGDHNGFVSKEEIKEALKNDQLSQDDRKSLESLQKRIEDIEEASNDEDWDENMGISKKDIDADYENLQKENKLIYDFESNLFTSGTRLNETPHTLYQDANDPLTSIRGDALQQGATGDCAFLAALAATARRNPQAVANMIKDNHDGTYTVTFPGDPDHSVTVNAPTDAELAGFAHGGENGTWPTVMEKAYGRYIKEQAGEGKSIDAENADSQSPEKALKLLTGKDPVRLEPSEMTNEELNAMFMNRDNYPITAGINGEFWAPLGISDNKDDETGLQRGHAYTVVGYDPVTKEVILRNPHGEAHKVGPDGKEAADTQVFRMSLDKFKKTFSRVSHS